MASGLIPPPPPNSILTDRIVKVAINVVTNGQNFEAFVRQKESNNPDFEFLRGGLFSEYYEYVKQTEAAKLAAQRVGVATEPPNIDVEQLRAQIVALKKQVAESEFNVDQQRLVLQKIDEAKVMELYVQNEKTKIDQFIADSGLNLSGLEKILALNSWSQSSVSQGKNWILDHCVTDRQREVAMMYLYYRVKTASRDSPLRLQVLYIADDLAAYCYKKQPLMTSTIGRYVPKFFAYASESSSDAIKEKLSKLVKYWEKGYPFDEKCLQQVKNPEKILMTEQTIMAGEMNGFRTRIDGENRKVIQGYEKQHTEFAKHTNAQIAALETNINNELRKKALTEAEDIAPNVPYYNLPAGVVVNMVKKEDFTYKPVEVDKIRLPNISQPSERLQSQLARFYMPMPESMLDENGWEKGGLDSFYQIKNAVKSQMEDVLKAEGKVMEDLFMNRYKSPSPDPLDKDKKYDDSEDDNKKADHFFAYSYDEEHSSLKRRRSPSDSPEYSKSGFGSQSKFSDRQSFSQPISFSLGKNY